MIAVRSTLTELEEPVLRFDHYQATSGGVSAKNFISLLREFQAIVRTAIADIGRMLEAVEMAEMPEGPEENSTIH